MGGSTLTREDVLELFQKVSNWGRWGTDDERGCLNYITSQSRLKAIVTVQEGICVSCAMPLNTVPSEENSRPVQHMMIRAGDVQGALGVSDYFSIATHGWAHTHLDALCHYFAEGKMYNDHPVSSVTSEGAYRNAITSAQDGVVSRGVLLDIPALSAREYLEPGEAIHPEDLQAAETRAGVTVSEGDILLLRTGRWLRQQKVGPWNGGESMAGMYADCLPWLHERRIAALGCDGVSDVLPSGVEGVRQPIHGGAIAMMGLHLLDNAYLEDLAVACAQRGRYEFLFMMAPLKLVRGTGCPVNPLAMF